MQRVGAYALLSLAGVGERERSPESLTRAEFERACAEMADDVIATAALPDTKAPHAFWLSASYFLWPNSPMNTTSRASLPIAERRARIAQWRTYPQTVLDVPCALCGFAARGFYGKVDVPLWASANHLNTTPPDHEGLALCVGCLASFHALPYGCSIQGGKVAALHSWDDAVLEAMTRRQVRRTRQEALLSAGGKSTQARYSREVEALWALRTYEHRVREGVELYVFSNDNQPARQGLDVFPVDQPLAEWLRAVLRSAELNIGFRYLVRAHYSSKAPGSVRLAYNAFHYPHRLSSTAANYLAGLTSSSGKPPGETTQLVALYKSMVREVLGVAQREIDQIEQLGDRIGQLLRVKPERGTLKEFEHVHADTGKLQSWLKKQAVAWTLRREVSEPLVSTEQWRLLFEPGDRLRFHRDLLFISVLQHLAIHGWLADDATVRGEQDDDILMEEQ
ncbi:hypothetical protein D5S18_02040 [Nocardia panacis]|uniref:Type I-B CRISPR-associated protein Cas8b1/Cst1 n=1 Tax=Nocardia panacis TaxID=2340916 RepID=A0A3A4K2W3_9NOCA|nr:hypothetical protein D5S18_02040 [Nocardia panacis]